MPLDLGAKGSCQIGGNVSTNAGGGGWVGGWRWGQASGLAWVVERAGWWVIGGLGGARQLVW